MAELCCFWTLWQNMFPAASSIWRLSASLDCSHITPTALVLNGHTAFSSFTCVSYKDNLLGLFSEICSCYDSQLNYMHKGIFFLWGNIYRFQRLESEVFEKSHYWHHPFKYLHDITCMYTRCLILSIPKDRYYSNSNFSIF